MKLQEETDGLQRKGGPDRENWLPVYAAGLSTFCVVTTEMLPVGLMTPIADDLQTSMGTAGLTLSLPALLAALFAPTVVLLAGRIDRRRILTTLLLLLVVANIISALASTIGLLLAARIIVGLCMGGIWAVAGGLALRLVPGRSIGVATAIIFGGVAAASVLGVPVGAMIGDAAGWRFAFAAMAVFCAIVLVVNLFALPALPVHQSVRLSQFGHQLLNRRIQLGLAITFLFVAGHFMAYTFIRPLLEVVSGIGTQWVGLMLFAYGAAGIGGNFVAGPVAARRTGATLLCIAGALAAVLFGFALFGNSALGGAVVLILWGIAYGGVSVSLQTWMMKSAPSDIEVATALFVAIFNIAIAAGSFAGGRIVDRFDLGSNLLVAGILPSLGILLGLKALRAATAKAD
ncbi:MFS transporter [Ensifer adhaerens]|jgi:predicted MFS family arabinose efflux permease|uniref:MFS transporter n=1 Tax=Ensifer adhaerens TaxID=106592 RepID=A0A9Q8YG25_ENSAD|nr:MFS transporter [Ensifer adhaerens]USJ28262.1 MFS transporter [Ensifer adhaerens]